MFDVIRFGKSSDLIFTYSVKTVGFCLTVAGISGKIKDEKTATSLQILGLSSMYAGQLIEELLTKSYIIYKQDSLEAMNDLEHELDKTTSIRK